MRIGLYAPFKPLDHPHPSGDQIIGRELASWLQSQGHQVRVVSRLRSRWIFHHPLRMLGAGLEIMRVIRELRAHPVDCWLTHHCYYKAPDLIGPEVRARLSIPYLIFQPSFATKYRKKPSTWPGFMLNRRALLRADHCVSNRRQDMTDLARIVPDNRLHFVAPGIEVARFARDQQARQRLRGEWHAGARPVILSAAMFRNDVKTQGLLMVLDTCQRLAAQGEDFLLVIAGDGPARGRLMDRARALGNRVRFVGRIGREEMAGFYSAGDLFVFPGFNESLGMVYLEAQACALPVVACDNGGIPFVVERDRTGFLVAVGDGAGFDQAVFRLLRDHELRRRMGENAQRYVRGHHDLERNYQPLRTILGQIGEEG